MKLKHEKALSLLNLVEVPADIFGKESSSKMQGQQSQYSDLVIKEYNDFWYMYFTNRAYAHILACSYKEAVSDLNSAMNFSNNKKLDYFSNFNLLLCLML